MHNEFKFSYLLSSPSLPSPIPVHGEECTIKLDISGGISMPVLIYSLFVEVLIINWIGFFQVWRQMWLAPFPRECACALAESDPFLLSNKTTNYSPAMLMPVRHLHCQPSTFSPVPSQRGSWSAVGGIWYKGSAFMKRADLEGGRSRGLDS